MKFGAVMLGADERVVCLKLTRRLRNMLSVAMRKQRNLFSLAPTRGDGKPLDAHPNHARR